MFIQNINYNVDNGDDDDHVVLMYDIDDNVDNDDDDEKVKRNCIIIMLQRFPHSPA